MSNDQKSPLLFGSKEASVIIRKNRQLEAEAREAGPDEGLPMKSWRVDVEITRYTYHLINARTSEEAMKICEDAHEGTPYDAWKVL